MNKMKTMDAIDAQRRDCEQSLISARNKRARIRRARVNSKDVLPLCRVSYGSRARRVLRPLNAFSLKLATTLSVNPKACELTNYNNCHV